MQTKNCRKRDDIDRIRTIYWFQCIRLAMGAPTAYALECLIEPKSLEINNEEKPSPLNKWATYQNGKHTPNVAQVARANLHVAGSSKALNHVLWKVLRHSTNVSAHADDWLRQLSPELQLLIYGRDDQFRIHGGRQFLAKFERRASIDALACLTILLRVSQENGDDEQAWQFAMSTFRVLLMLGHQFAERKIADMLFKIYVERIFTGIKWNGERFYLGEYVFSLWADLLHQFARNTLQTKGRSIAWREEAEYMLRVLEGNYGLDLTLSFKPLIGPEVDEGPWREEKQKELERVVRLLTPVGEWSGFRN